MPPSMQEVTEQPLLPAANHNELLPRVLRGAFWMLNSNLFGRVMALARGVILARLLVPDDFGLFGLASVVIGFTAMFSDVGAGAFLVYSQDGVQDHVDTAFWANLGIATLLSASVCAAAPFVAHFYHRNDLTPVLLVLAISLWLQVATTVHRNLVRRVLRFRALAIVDALIALCTFLAAVALAWGGYGVWAFVLSGLAGNVISAFLLFYVYAWVPRWRFSAESLRALAPFSGWYVAQAIAWYLVLNIDNLMVGKFLGIAALGVYGLAYNYSLLPVSLIGIALGNVVYAELPRLYGDPPRFWSAFFLYSKLLISLICPLSAALVIAAPDIFPLLFGSKWNSAIVPFQILAVHGAIRSIWIDPFSALGKFRPSFWLGAATLCVSSLAIYLALPYGQAGVAVAVLIAVGAASIANLLVASRSKAKCIQGLRNAAPYFATAAGAAVVALAARHVFALAVSNRKLWLAAVSITVLLGIYGTVFQKEFRGYLDIFTGKQKVELVGNDGLGS